jgi:nucleotide-binding universal stress UspA family protein
MPSTAPATAVSFKRILVATDFSQSSEKALHHAIAIARHFDATLYLTHVVSALGFVLAGPDATLAASEAALGDVRRLEDRLSASGVLTGVNHEIVVREGDIWEQIQEVVKDEDIDLIVVGTHGRSGIRKVVLGSVAEEIFRHASCPVLTVGPYAPPEAALNTAHEHVLFATDFSPESLEALPFVLRTSREHHAKLTLLHVVEHLSGEAALDTERVISVGEQRLRQLLPPRYEGEYECRVEIGAIEEAILDVAEMEHANVIMLGLKSPETYVDHLGWLHAYRIVRSACCPVLTIRSGGAVL